MILVISGVLFNFNILKTGYNRNSLAFLRELSSRPKDECDNTTSVMWGRAVNDGHWYDFSRPPLFVFYVYSAFLVDQGSHDVIRLISITTPVEHFTGQRLNIFCVVRYCNQSKLHVASIIRRPPRVVSVLQVVRGNAVGDYVYSCPLPEHRQEGVPVSIR